MAAICIGGVCIPYSAILPLIALGLKWIVTQLTNLGLFPVSLAKKIGIHSTTTTTATTNGCCSAGSCSTAETKNNNNSNNSETAKTTTTTKTIRSSRTKSSQQPPPTKNTTTTTPPPPSTKPITTLTDTDQWNSILQNDKQNVTIAKFTASWCKPCKQIDPFYTQLAQQYHQHATFVKIDVDEYDTIAADCRVSMMPTFVVFKEGRESGCVRGADEGRLEEFVREHCCSSSSVVR